MDPSAVGISAVGHSQPWERHGMKQSITTPSNKATTTRSTRYFIFTYIKKTLQISDKKKKKNFWKCTHHPTKIYINQSVCFNTCSSQIQLWRWRGGGTSVLPPRDLRSCSAGGGRGARGWAGQGGAEEGLGGALLVLIPLLWGWGGEKEMKQLSLGLICVRQRI